MVLRAIFRIAFVRDQPSDKAAIFTQLEPARGYTFTLPTPLKRDAERGSCGITPYAPSMLTDRERSNPKHP